jgi:hypothetical protein
MKGPKYVPIPRTMYSSCSICGGIIADQKKHTSFHQSLARLLGLEVDDAQSDRESGSPGRPSGDDVR